MISGSRASAVRLRSVAPSGASWMPAPVPGERLGNFGHRQHEVDPARHDRAARHAVIAGLVGILRDDQPAFFLHGLQPEAAVGAGAGKDHADGACPAVLRQRVQQEIERQARAMTRLGLRELQGAVTTDR